MIGRPDTVRARTVAVLAVLLTLVVPAVAAPAAPGGRVAAAPPTARFVGVDGLVHEPAPGVVSGTDGYLFLGADLDFACGADRAFATAMDRFRRLAEVIARSGRRVVFTVAPNKSAALPGRLARPLPHGRCDRAGLAAQDRLLRGFDSPDYLPLVPALRASSHQVYWRTDQHWTTVGGAVFARQLAHRLEPGLGRRQRYAYGTETRMGAMATVLGLSTPETLETATPTVPVRVRTAPGAQDWSGYPQFTFEHAWTSRPAKRTWPGRTLVLGDSFGWYALESLRPLFRRGHFVWIGHTGVDVPQEIRRSDTVVIELLQLFTGSTQVLTAEFRREVRRALR